MSRAGAAAATGAGKKLGSHMSWLWRGPRRALSAARDLYVNSLMGCAGQLPGDAAFGYPTFAGGAGAPYSMYSASSSAASSRRFSNAGSGSDGADEDLRELIRAASQRHQRAAAEQERQQRHPAAVPRSQSVAAASGVAMVRIDEDGPCDFASAAAAVVVPRSRSYAAPGSGRHVAGGRRGRVAALAA